MRLNENWDLIVLHTNDSHGHVVPFTVTTKDICSQLRVCTDMSSIKELGGCAELGTLIEIIREKNSHVLLFDTGNMFCDTMIANLTKGRLQASIMNELKYDAMCPGNHDIDYGAEELKKISKELTFPILAANMLDNETNDYYLEKPYIIKNINGLTIGIYGLTYHLTPETTSRKNVEGVKYTLDFDNIKTDINIMRSQGAEFIILLSHLGTSVDEKLAREIDCIDLILGGHSHDPISYKTINKTIISQATPHLSGLGCLQLHFNKKELLSVQGKIIPILSERIPKEAKVNSIINTVIEEYETELKNPIGFSVTPIIRNYKSESPSETLFGNILRFMTDSEISILPGSGYGVTIPKGIITKEALTNLLPHDSSIYTGFLKGKDILTALNQSIFNQINPDVTKRVGGLIQVTGLQFYYTYSTNYQNYIRAANVNGKPIEKEKYYRVVMNQLMMEGGHKYHSLRNAISIEKSKKSDIDLIIDYLSTYFPVSATKQNLSIPLTNEDFYKSIKQCFPI